MALFDCITEAIENPNFPWKKVIIGISVGQFVFESYLSYRQYKVLCKKQLPPVLEGEIDKETFEKSEEYSKAKIKFSIVSDTIGLLQNIAFIKYDILPKLWNFGQCISKAVFPAKYQAVSIVAQSLMFLFTMSNLSTVLGLPIAYYSHFVLEEKFGFNKLTVKLWIMDMIKGNLLGYVIGGPILYLFLKIFDLFETNFLWYICLFFLVVQVLAMVLVPVFIMPLFNKFTPLEDGELKVSIENLAKDCGFPLDKVFVVDGSKRSSHSNAYFTGLPFTSKRIVLFDTLVSQSSIKEITAVLAHEIGHWKMNHVLNLLVISQAHILLIMKLFTSVYRNESFYNAFGFILKNKEEIISSSLLNNNSIVFTQGFPILIGFLLFNDLLTPLESIVQFGMSLLQRKQEYQADDFADKRGLSTDLSHALINLQIKNLSTMSVDKLYSSYHYSHPTLAERLTALNYISEKKKE
ncbi:CAAX prenyl protease 1 [Monosporozyma unispora]|nr:zinc metalloprotease [Kazachstania unispora]